jgi:hypothetical protein
VDRITDRDIARLDNPVWLLGRRGNQPLALALPSFLFLALTLWLVANVLVRPIYGPAPYSPGTVLVAAAILIALLPAVIALAEHLVGWFGRRKTWASRLAIVAVFAVILVAQLRFAFAVVRFPGWDAGQLVSNAIALADGDETIGADYYTRYPFNIPLTLVLWKAIEFSRAMGISNDLLSPVLLNSVVLFLGLVFTYLIARKLLSPAIALISLIPSAVFIAFSAWINTAYSDTFSLVFTVVLVYLFLRLREQTTTGRRLLFWVLVGVTAGVGSVIKITVLIALIAIVFVVAATLRPRREPRTTTLTAVAGMALAALCVLGIGQAVTFAESKSGVVPFDLYTNDRDYPLAHFLKMGSQGLGNWNLDDVRATDELPTKAERSQKALEVYVERVGALGPAGYAAFLTDKASWSIGDSTFYQSGEGESTDSPFTATDALSTEIQSFFDLNGSRHTALVSLWQALWTVILLLIVAPLFIRDRRLFSDAASVLRISVLGLLLYLMLFENRARYIYLYVPFFILLASLSLDALHRVIRERRKARAHPEALNAKGAHLVG